MSDTSDTSYQSDTDFQPFSINFDISNGSPIDTNNFTVISYNINSITAFGRLDELTDICNTLKVGVLILTETKLDDTIPSNILAIPGYHEPLRKDRNRNGGGTMIYIADHLVFNQRQDLEEDSFEHIWVDMKVNNTKYCVNTYYRPPNESADDHNTFLETTERILTKINTHQHDFAFIAADLNFGNSYCKYPTLQPKPLDSRACDLFESQGMFQIIDIPTRVTESTTSLIDLFFVSNLTPVVTYGTLPKIADHDGVLCSFRSQSEKPKPKTICVYDYRNVDEKGLIQYIKQFNFDNNVFCHPTEYQANYVLKF